MKTLTPREVEICDAAARMFMRYGVKRASMNDIAAEANVARQTLYNAFANKDELLVATIGLYMDRAVAEAESALQPGMELGEKLEIVFEHLARRPFAMLRAAPNTEDIIEGVGMESKAAIEEGYQRFGEILTQILSPQAAQIQASGLSVASLAEAALRFACAAKHEARDAAHLDELLRTLNVMTVSVAQGGNARP